MNELGIFNDLATWKSDANKALESYSLPEIAANQSEIEFLFSAKKA